MNAPASPIQSRSSGAPAVTGALGPAEIDASCRVPLFMLFLSAAVWLLAGSVFALLASIKFHSPQFLAHCAWLTYGRIWPAAINSVLYGFCLPAGLGVGLWLFARLGRTPLVGPLFVIAGAVFWNLGVTLGVGGILLGDSTGFEFLELPTYSAAVLFVGYLLLGIWSVLTFRQRRERQLFVSQWFLFAALFWFPWIFSSAEMLLLGFRVRGVTQAVINWWYADNLLVVWLGLVGLASVFYFISKLSNRDLHSHYLALFTFWGLILFGSWGGIPGSAPVPAWMPVISTVATTLLILPLLTVVMNVHRTLEGKCGRLFGHPLLPFIGFGVAAFVVAGLMHIFGCLLDTTQVLHFSWFSAAEVQLYLYGFFVMVMFGAISYILPRLAGVECACPKMTRLQLVLAILGILLVALPLAIGGVLQALQLQNPNQPFMSIVKATLPFLRASTVGYLLVLVANLVFLLNLIGVVARFYQAQATRAYTAITTELKPAEVKS